MLECNIRICRQFLQMAAVHENENNNKKITLKCRVHKNYKQFSKNTDSCREVRTGCIFTIRTVKPIEAVQPPSLDSFKTRQRPK